MGIETCFRFLKKGGFGLTSSFHSQWTRTSGLSLLFLLGLMVACQPAPRYQLDADSSETSEEQVNSLLQDDSHLVDFSDVEEFVFSTSCTGCHNGSRQEGGLDLSNYDKLMNPSVGVPWVKPYHPTESPLMIVLFMEHENRRMPPPGEEPLTYEQKELLERWIAQGAQESRTHEHRNGRPQSLSEQLAGYLEKPETIDYPVVQEFVFDRARCTQCHAQGHERTDSRAILFGADLSSYKRLGFLNAIVPGRLHSDIWKDEMGVEHKRSGSRIYEMLEPYEQGNRRLEAKGAWPLQPLQKEILRLWILNCAVEDAESAAPAASASLNGESGKVRFCDHGNFNFHSPE